MNVKQKKSAPTSPIRDDPPEITESWVQEANLMRGEKVLRRGRPKLESPKQLLSLRLPPKVIASWKASGPGWQTRMAEVLRKSSPKARKQAG